MPGWKERLVRAPSWVHLLSQILLAGVLYGALTLVLEVHDSIVVWSLSTAVFAVLYGAVFALVAVMGRRRTRHGGDASG